MSLSKMPVCSNSGPMEENLADVAGHGIQSATRAGAKAGDLRRRQTEQLPIFIFTIETVDIAMIAGPGQEASAPV